jgi:hypothetical protein
MPDITVDNSRKSRPSDTLLDARAYPVRELILLYHERWKQEPVYDEQKTRQAPRHPGKEAHPAERNARGSGAGDLRPVAGALR